MTTHAVALEARLQRADRQAEHLNDHCRLLDRAHDEAVRERDQAQAQHTRLIDRDGLSYCGAYWGNGFHEDGVQSALRVCQQLLGCDPWKVLSTSAGSPTVEKLPSSTNFVTACS